ncbi:MAG: DUF3343 domain-containing protein [Syntrophomonadaceae bacterium]|nr:DUF3343 domain-containing protein [Syntrophomonadaceae bacterium]
MTKHDDIGSLIKLNEYCVITFTTTSAALKGEKLMKAADRRFVIMPTPRELSTSCGLSLKVKPEDVRESYRILREGGVDVEGVYHLSRDGDKKNVVPLHLD